MTPRAEVSRPGRARRVLWVVAPLLAAVLAWRFAPVGRWVEAATRGLGELGPPVGAGLYAVGCLLCVPGGPMSLASGYLFGAWVGGSVVWAGAMLGSASAFGLARAIGRPRLRGRPRGGRLARLDRAIARRGGLAVLLLRLNPAVPFNLASYGLGLTSVRPGPYLLGTALGMLPGVALYAALGASLGPGGRLGPWGWGATALLLVSTTLGLGHLARRALREPEDYP